MAFDANYANRDGFAVDFLRPGKLDGRVLLPTLADQLAPQAAPLLGKKAGSVLHYHHYSVVLHKARRFAISAPRASISAAASRFRATRTSGESIRASAPTCR